MSLERFAWRISGPIDAAINLSINSMIPWALLPSGGSIPWFGWPSAFSFIGTMVFCVALFASYFGIRSGIMRRAAGVAPGPVSPDVPWSRIAWRIGFLYGAVGYLVAIAFFLIVHMTDSQLQLPCWWVILGDGALAAVLAYAFHVRGVQWAQSL